MLGEALFGGLSSSKAADTTFENRSLLKDDVDIESWKNSNSKQLQIVVPDVEMTEAQIQAINNATAYANEKGIDIIITVGKKK